MAMIKVTCKEDSLDGLLKKDKEYLFKSNEVNNMGNVYDGVNFLTTASIDRFNYDMVEQQHINSTLIIEDMRKNLMELYNNLKWAIGEDANVYQPTEVAKILSMMEAHNTRAEWYKGFIYGMQFTTENRKL